MCDRIYSTQSYMVDHVIFYNHKKNEQRKKQKTNILTQVKVRDPLLADYISLVFVVLIVPRQWSKQDQPCLKESFLWVDKGVYTAIMITHLLWTNVETWHKKEQEKNELKKSVQQSRGSVWRWPHMASICVDLVFLFAHPDQYFKGAPVSALCFS